MNIQQVKLWDNEDTTKYILINKYVQEYVRSHFEEAPPVHAPVGARRLRQRVRLRARGADYSEQKLLYEEFTRLAQNTLNHTVMTEVGLMVKVS